MGGVGEYIFAGTVCSSVDGVEKQSTQYALRSADLKGS